MSEKLKALYSKVDIGLSKRTVQQTEKVKETKIITPEEVEEAAYFAKNNSTIRNIENAQSLSTNLAQRITTYSEIAKSAHALNEQSERLLSLE